VVALTKIDKIFNILFKYFNSISVNIKLLFLKALESELIITDLIAFQR
jgi:hypothetical protein